MPVQRKYPDELRERAVRMVLEIRARDGKDRGELARVGRQLGVHPEALRGWVRQAPLMPGGRGRIPLSQLALRGSVADI
jgi:transposase